MFIRSIAVLFLMCSIEMPVQALQDFSKFRIWKSDVPEDPGLAYTVRRTFLEEHNGRRALLAEGGAEIKNGEKLPHAANMRFMAYNRKLEDKANELTKSCERTLSEVELTTSEFTTNFASIDSYEKNGEVSAAREAVSQWWNKSSQWQNPQELTMENNSAIPFFLIAQAVGDEVGCSVRPCYEEGGYGVSYYSVACVYEKKVEVGTKLYEEGQACTKCPEGYNTRYKDALCKKPKQPKP